LKANFVVTYVYNVCVSVQANIEGKTQRTTWCYYRLRGALFGVRDLCFDVALFRPINQGPRHVQNYASTKELWVCVLGFFMILLAVPWVLLRGLGEKIGSGCEEFEDSEDGISTW